MERCCESYSHSESLQNAPMWNSLWHWISSECPRSSCSCRLPNWPNNLVQDEWLLSLTKTWKSTYQHILSSMLPLKNVEYPAVIPNFFCKKWKIFVTYWWFLYFLFWNSVLGVTVRTSFLVPVEYEDTSMSSCFQGCESWAFSCFLTWELSTSGRWVVRTSFLVPVWLPCPSSAFSKSTGYPKSCGGFSLASCRVSSSLESLVVVSPPVNLHWKSLLDLSLTWRSAFRSDQKENCWNGCARERREIHNVEQTKKMVPLVTRETHFC